MDLYEEKKKGITPGKIFKSIVICLCITIIACVVIRSISARDVELTEKIIYNEKTLEAYENGEIVVREYALMDFWRPVYDNQLLEIDHLYYAPAANQLQVCVKYRTSYAHEPTADGKIPFSFYLEDELGMYFDDYFYETDSTGKYAFIRVCFENITLRPQNDPEGGKLYRFYIELENADGEFEPLESFELYDGSSLYQERTLKLSTQ